MAKRLFIALVTGDDWTDSFHCLDDVWDLGLPPNDEDGYDAIKAVVAEQFCRKHWDNLEEVPPYEEVESPQQAFHIYFNENLEGESCSFTYFDPGEFSRETLELMLQDVK